MFQELLGNDHQNIGERNVMAARTALGEGGIKIIGEDVGGDFGRTVRFDLKKGEVRVKSSRTDIDVVV
jgi:chemotaxis protein CheD